MTERPESGTALHLSIDLRRELEEHAAAGYPCEACGVLIGLAQEPLYEVRQVTRARNLNTERAHDRYVLDPADLLAAEVAAQEGGLAVIGIWHSHPDHPAQPSETDREAAWEGWSYVIAAVTAAGVTDLRSFRLHDETFESEKIQTS